MQQLNKKLRIFEQCQLAESMIKFYLSRKVTSILLPAFMPVRQEF
jgi:hypothetical protein